MIQGTVVNIITDPGIGHCRSERILIGLDQLSDSILHGENQPVESFLNVPVRSSFSVPPLIFPAEEIDKIGSRIILAPVLNDPLHLVQIGRIIRHLPLLVIQTGGAVLIHSHICAYDLLIS